VAGSTDVFGDLHARASERRLADARRAFEKDEATGSGAGVVDERTQARELRLAPYAEHLIHDARH
jgi:hypothetical protein